MARTTSSSRNLHRSNKQGNSKNDVQLFVVENPRHVDTGVGMEVDKMGVAFRQRMPYDKKLVISVRANGEAYVAISISSVSQAKQYMLNVLEVTNEQLEATFSTSWMRIHRNRKSRPAKAEALVRARGNLVAKSGARMSGRSLSEMSPKVAPSLNPSR